MIRSAPSLLIGFRLPPEAHNRKDPMAENSPISRRSALTVGAWTIPVLALTVAAPARAASAEEEFTLNILTPQATNGQGTQVRVNIPASAAQALEFGGVQLTYSRTAGTGALSASSGPVGWEQQQLSPTSLQFYSTFEAVVGEGTFQCQLFGPSVWDVELAWQSEPSGTLTGQINVAAPA
ncbi:hypothetical protein [Pseudoclavibacter sp. 8L]|uniref:hypothetical protein n=1 Tax=Pseudoclavibacter sp. 8L TaxID=2653162 RepID=UPI0012F44E48|nr:hypothetical protein [Pseudoclavibacter sp. 8L]VXB36128.1 hypothetical protein PSCLAVI8L_130561 [Pseudoclavibacter sp. 8L]